MIGRQEGWLQTQLGRSEVLGNHVDVMAMFPYSDAVISCLAWLLLYWSENVSSYPRGCWTVIQLHKWNESFLAWFSSTVNLSPFKCQKWCRNTALFSPGYLHISSAVREQLSWCGGIILIRPFLKTEFKTRTFWSPPLMSNIWYPARHCWGTLLKICFLSNCTIFYFLKNAWSLFEIV